MATTRVAVVSISLKSGMLFEQVGRFPANLKVVSMMRNCEQTGARKESDPSGTLTVQKFQWMPFDWRKTKTLKTLKTPERSHSFHSPMLSQTCSNRMKVNPRTHSFMNSFKNEFKNEFMSYSWMNSWVLSRLSPRLLRINGSKRSSLNLAISLQPTLSAETCDAAATTCSTRVGRQAECAVEHYARTHALREFN